MPNAQFPIPNSQFPKIMRVLQIIPSIALVYGGPSQMVLELSRSLAQQGVEVTILTTNANGDAGQPPLDVPLDRPVTKKGYKIRYFPCAPFRRYKFSLGLVRWLNQHAEEYDLAHLHALFSPVISAAATVAKVRNLPYILRPLGTLDPADLRKKKQLKQVYAAVWERGNIAGAAALHFTSTQEAKISERFGLKTRDLVIPLGVYPDSLDSRERSPGVSPANESAGDRTLAPETARERLGIPSDRPLVLFLSRIEPKKGLSLLFPALEQLLAEGLDFHFVLAGSNPQDPEYESKMRSQIQASPLASRTAITGFVTGAFKASLLREADLFVLPSFYENFGIAVAEAMAAGTAVCISRGVYIWEDVRDASAGWVCDADVDSLVGILREAIQNPEQCRLRGINGRSLAVQNYSWQAIGQQTIQAYREIIAR